MDRPSWAPIIVSGALPREISDLIAITILELATIPLFLSETRPFTSLNASWILLPLAPLTGLLAALSNSTNREREELALVAYGGSPRQIELRYFLRGSIIATIGLLPLILRDLIDRLTMSPPLLILILLILMSGSTYTIPALRRTHSLSFVEQYKG